jgi:hypothetical protein
MVKEKGLEGFAFRLSEVVDGLVKRVDLDTYGTFRAIMLTEGKELEESLSHAEPEVQPEIQDLASKFFEVGSIEELTNHRCLRIMSQQKKRLRRSLARQSTYRPKSPVLTYVPLCTS